MIYLAVYVELFPRVVISIISAMMYSYSSNIMYEFKFYSSDNVFSNINIDAIWLVILCGVMVIFYFHSKMLNNLIDDYRVSDGRVNPIEQYSPLVLLAIFAFLIIEVRSLGVFGVDLTISKRNYMSFVTHPAIFRVVHAVFPIFLLFAASYVIKRSVRKLPLGRVFLVQIFLAFLAMTIFYLILQQKSFIIRTPLMFFVSPLLIYFARTKNVNALVGLFVATAAAGLFAAFAYQYRTVLDLTEVPGAIANRLLLEGQLNYLNMALSLSSSGKLDFFRYFGPFRNPEAAMFDVIYAYARDDLVLRASMGQWTASGLMPGFIFRVDLWPVYLAVWIAVFLYSGYMITKSYRHIIAGDVISCYLGIKLSITLFQFVVQGSNFLSSPSFWIYFVLYFISSHMFNRQPYRRLIPQRVGA